MAVPPGGSGTFPASLYTLSVGRSYAELSPVVLVPGPRRSEVLEPPLIE